MSLYRLTARPGLLVIPLLLFLLLVFHFSSSDRSSFFSFSSSCEPNYAALQKLNLSSKISYTRAEVHARYSSTVTPSEQLEVELPPFLKLSLADATADREARQCTHPLALTFLPPAKRPDLSHVTFGVATTIDRLEVSVGDFRHWIEGTHTTVLAYLEPAPEDATRRVKEKAAAMGFTLQILESTLSFTDRYFTLAKLIYEQRLPGTKWGVLIDDDTFFVSPSGFAEYLAGFDSNKAHYIGGLTEDFGQIKNFGIMGYGGASIILSMPLLQKMYEVYEPCFAQKGGGDIMIANCIYQHTGTKFTMEHRLHQFDMNGDLSGIYEGGSARPQPLSVHHWKSWHKANMTITSAVAPVCGDDCLFQRFKFTNGWWLTNGYSLVKYSKDIPIGEITMEHTWNEKGDYRHSFDPLRPKDDGKISLRLEDFEVTRDRVTQFYVRRKSDADEVFELVWKK